MVLKNGGGEILPHWVGSSQDSGIILQYYTHNFADERKGVFRYLVCGDGGGAFNHPAKYNKYEAMHVYYNSKLLFFMRAFTQRTKILYLVSQAQHEIGYSLGITPWSFEGCDNLSYEGGRQNEKKFVEKWGNYYSCLNYYFINQKGGNLLYKPIDYSDGSGGEGDQNDWMALYLPAFQMEARVIEEVHFDLPCVDKIVDEELKYEFKDWDYAGELTEKFIVSTGGWSPVNPIKVDWFVFEKSEEGDKENVRDIRVYAMPKVYPTIAGLTLSYEGKLNSDGEIEFYLAQELINEII